MQVTYTTLTKTDSEDNNNMAPRNSNAVLAIFGPGS